MKEEQYLIEKLGKENPFKVPDGYFDSLTSQVMARVDAEQKQQAGPKARTVWLRPVLYALIDELRLAAVGKQRSDHTLRAFLGKLVRDEMTVCGMYQYVIQ